ncbi:hypothetical protein QAD02_024436 [Eretmocerus hayati]|uniref:Uncharacterized protein n=1 Tax=Eretmocerus hayati TaxID=131215 RepID=A0ACC2PYK6_9HYME|nr:hypothetical protein QAD02_024436 [Eretmocerus hayati]
MRILKTLHWYVWVTAIPFANSKESRILGSNLGQGAARGGWSGSWCTGVSDAACGAGTRSLPVENHWRLRSSHGERDRYTAPQPLYADSASPSRGFFGKNSGWTIPSLVDGWFPRA